jgi:hypothetical protein
MPDDDAIELTPLYAYAYKGQDMFAITSPFRMAAPKPELIGERVRIEGVTYVVRSIGRVTHGPIHKGEIVGIVVEPAQARGTSATATGDRATRLRAAKP